MADIDRWNAQAVREVFHAAKSRAEVTLEVSRQLATLSIFASSGGKTAEAAAHQNEGFAAISTPTVTRRWPLPARLTGPRTAL
ncbi:hypothetical protein BZL30_0406 [Mycobacterium kansasii]|uniref:Uncharacterized protein n=1 Tax=Mycobacterium kansasii TaxID=1768 RepID=A0A1V3XU89_MYCKA|nr:hypothetical protein BZL30_0406 [Mycobacterium kansasii]